MEKLMFTALARLPKQQKDLFNRILLFFAALFLYSALSPAHAQIKTNGRFVYNHCGEKVIFRGVEHMLYWHDLDGAMVSEIAKTGANYVRILLDPGITGTKLRDLMQICVDVNKMYVSVALWDSYNNQDWWNRADIKAVLMDYQNFIVIHGAGEANGTVEEWKNTNKAIIAKIRGFGYKCPIDIMSTTAGRDPYPVIDHGQEIVDADPEKNIILGVQLYWGSWYTGQFGMSIAEACSRFATLNFPVQIGACPSDCGNDCWRQAWEESYKNQLGCAWWAWKGDEFQLTPTGQFSDLNAMGREIATTGTYSISKTSVKYSGSCPDSNPSPVTLRDPENPSGTSAGLEYKYFEGTWSALPDFAALTAAETGTVNSFDLSVRNRDDNFGFQFSGFIDVPADGTYTFYTSSDDGSKLYIGTTEVVNNDGLHGAQERSGTIGLKAGKHALTVVFFEAGGGQVLSVSYSGPSLSKTAVPASALFRTGGGTTDPDPTPGSLTKITGTTFGTAPWVNCTSCTADRVFDGRTDTYFDANAANGAYAGIDAGSAKVVTQIRYHARIGNPERVVGGKFQGSNTSSSSGFVDLYTIPSQPTVDWQEVNLPTNSTGYRYLRYLAPNGGHGNIAEVAFYEGGGSARLSAEAKAAEIEVSVFPNPAHELLHLKFKAAQAGRGEVVVRNAFSQNLLKNSLSVTAGDNQVTLSTARLGKGVRFVTIRVAGKNITRKIVIQ